jgi:hypothetical protein
VAWLGDNWGDKDCDRRVLMLVGLIGFVVDVVVGEFLLGQALDSCVTPLLIIRALAKTNAKKLIKSALFIKIILDFTLFKRFVFIVCHLNMPIDRNLFKIYYCFISKEIQLLLVIIKKIIIRIYPFSI